MAMLTISKKGSALLTVLLTLSAVGVLLLLASRTAMDNSRISSRYDDASYAHQAAESGLEAGIARASSGTMGVNTVDVQCGQDICPSYEIKVSQLDSQGIYLIESTGQFNGVYRKMIATRSLSDGAITRSEFAGSFDENGTLQ